MAKDSETSGKALQVVGKIQDTGIDGVGPFKSSVEVAEECLRVSGGDREAAIDRLIRVHVRLASTNGAVTGLGGLITLPVTVTVGVAGYYLVGARLAAGIAYLRGHDVYSEDVRTVVTLCLLGSAGTELLKDIGVTVGTKSLAAAVKKIPGKVLIEINKKVGFRLLTKAGRTGVFNLSKMVPLAGAPIGAVVEATACRAVGKYAKSAFEPVALLSDRRPGS